MTTQLLVNKVAAITGGATGIGRAIALEYLRQGAKVAINHLGDEKSAVQFEQMLAEKPADGQLIAVPGDISKPETAKRLVDETVGAFGRLDVFVSNAGVCRFADFLECVFFFSPCREMRSLTCMCAAASTRSTGSLRSTPTSAAPSTRRRPPRARWRRRVAAAPSSASRPSARSSAAAARPTTRPPRPACSA